MAEILDVSKTSRASNVCLQPVDSLFRTPALVKGFLLSIKFLLNFLY